MSSSKSQEKCRNVYTGTQDEEQFAIDYRRTLFAFMQASIESPI
jgi:hypothetical protein